MKALLFLPAPRGVVVCAAALAMVTSGCSTFRREWKAATAKPPPAKDISGPWEGSWRSDVNGHHGRLRCVVSRLDGGRYRARYKATYWKIFRFGYTVVLQVAQPSSDTFRFRGEADLGWWGGGVYHYDGHATPMNFFSTYKSEHDHGSFEMTRPGKPGNAGGVGALK